MASQIEQRYLELHPGSAERMSMLVGTQMGL